MAQATTVIKSTSKVDLMNELHLFIGGCTKQTRCNPLDLTKTSLFLLKNLPAARSAVLEYLRNVFDSAALSFIVRIEKEISTGKLPPPDDLSEAILTEVYTVLSSFVLNNAEIWAPIISTWSLELLGEISSRYEGRAHLSPGLNETLQLWMNCRSTRTLIDITTQCLSCLMNANTEACINALLDTSVKHSPNFDWVVAHVGSCFPQTVIVRVLSCGLKDFCQNKSYQQGCESPKLKSVVGILSHLATGHADDVQKALLDLFNWCLQDVSFQEQRTQRTERRATVPYLLQLLSLSSTLLNSVTSEIRNAISVPVVHKLFSMAEHWLKFFGSPEAFQDLLVSLILKCESGGSQIIELLLDCVVANPVKTETDHSIINRNARELLECVLGTLDSSVRYRAQVNLLNSLSYDIESVYCMVLRPEWLRAQTATRIITYIGQNNPPMLIQALSYIFQNSKSDEHLVYLVRIASSELVDQNVPPYSDRGGYFSVMLEQILEKYHERSRGGEEQYLQVFINLLKLLQWEKTNKIFMLSSKWVSRAIENNLDILTGIYKIPQLDTETAHIVSEILDSLDFTSASIALPVTMNLVNGSINYFFLCCKETKFIARLLGFKRVKNILSKLCSQSKISRNFTLKLLLERALFSKDSQLLGAKDGNPNAGLEPNKQLILQNKKLSKTIHLTKHSSVYNGGIIGTGRRKSVCPHQPPDDIISANTAQLMAVLKVCCLAMNNGKGVDVSLDSLTLVSLMLVQLVSPDVMYNGLPWPEEEFSKVTIERDLFIRRLFTNTPLLWDLLSFVALHRPTLSYCSVLIRALTATLMHQWSSMGDQSKSSDSISYKGLMNTTVKVMDLMSLGQLLPPPLSNVRDIVPYLNCTDIVAILRESIWYYMRDHIPSPALFECDSNGLYWRNPAFRRPTNAYTSTVRVVMQRNVKTVGHLFSQMFITIPEESS